MNTNTGQIVSLDEMKAMEKLNKQFDDSFVTVLESEMTDKQKKNRQVSLHDHTSGLGILLTNERQRKRQNK